MFSRGFLGSVPPVLINTVIRSADVAGWGEVFVACSGTFRTEKLVLGACPGAIVRSNDVSLFSVAMGRWLTGAPLDFQFVRDLGFVEELGLCEPVDRVAAIVVAMTMAGYSGGKANRFKSAHLEHFRDKFLGYVTKQAAKIEPFKAVTPVSSFFAGDWLAHIDAAIAAGAGVLAYPPTFKGGYEKMFAFINANVEWDAPKYDLWNPNHIGEVTEKLDASGIPYFIYADQEIKGRKPAIEFDQNGRRTIYGYARAKRDGYLTKSLGPGEAFAYTAVDPGTMTPASLIAVVPAAGKRLIFLKNVYLKKTIQHSSGMVNFLVYVDGKLAGAMIYSLEKFNTGERRIFLLSDFSTTRSGRVAKLIARIAACREVVSYVERHFVIKIDQVATAVFSDNPVSMKYRGVFELTKREERNAPEGKYCLFYVAQVHDETAQDAYAWWAARNLGKAPGKNHHRQPEGAAAA